MSKWIIDKSFSFCYGHRVWSQVLEGEFCSKDDCKTKCRALHGHEGLLHVFLEGNELTRGMVTDFKHLGWLKDFIDTHIDHKFILDHNDPWFKNIINGSIGNADFPHSFSVLKLANPSSEIKVLPLEPILIPNTDHWMGYSLDVSELEGPEQEFYEGFFIVDFLPTSENLCKWIHDGVQVKMDRLGVKVQRIEWNETPKSRSMYTA